MQASILKVANSACLTSFPFHRQSFIDANYKYINPQTRQELSYPISLVLPTEGKHPFMQVCISDSNDDNTPSMLFFGEEYGFPTATCDKNGLSILYGNSDWLNHSAFLLRHQDFILEIYTLYKCLITSGRLAGSSRSIVVGCANSIGHNLINDAGAFVGLARASLLNRLKFNVISLGSGWFDAQVATNLFAVNKVTSPDYYLRILADGHVPFCARSYGYGITTGVKKLILQGVSPMGLGELLWINIRAESEERAVSEYYARSMRILDKCMETQAYHRIVFDGLTRATSSACDPKYRKVVDEQTVIARTMQEHIQKKYPRISFVSLIDKSIQEKLAYVQLVSLFIGSFGSGTWPLAFMPKGVAHILFVGDKKGLATDPLLDYKGIPINASIFIHVLGSC